ncbi:MAG: hypothetical protein ABEH56_00890 [Salinirussus sp.]
MTYDNPYRSLRRRGAVCLVPAAGERLRALFAWPTRLLAVNYLLVGSGLILLQCLSYFGVLLVVAGTGTVTGSEAALALGGVALALGVVWYAILASGGVLVVGLVVMFANLPT